MAGNKRPSYLKRQKEQQRMARAAEKREERRQRKAPKGEGELDGNKDDLDGLAGPEDLEDLFGPREDAEV
jgi:hypothetical protein